MDGKKREYKIRKDGVAQHYNVKTGPSDSFVERKTSSAREGIQRLAAGETVENVRKVRGGGAVRGFDVDGREVWFLSSPSGDAFKPFVEDVKKLPKEKRFFNAKLKKWVVVTGSEADSLMARYGLTEEREESSLDRGEGSLGSDDRVSASGGVDSDGVAILRVAVPVDVYLSSGMRDAVKHSGLVGRTWDDASKQWIFLDTPKAREFLAGYGIVPSFDGELSDGLLSSAREVAKQKEALLEVREAGRRRGNVGGYTRRRTVDGGYAYYDDSSDDEYDAWKDGALDSLPGVSDARYVSYRRGKRDAGRWR